MWLTVKCGLDDSCDGAEMDGGTACEAKSVLLLSPGKSRRGTVGCVLSVGMIKCSVMLRCKDGGGNSVRG